MLVCAWSLHSGGGLRLLPPYTSTKDLSVYRLPSLASHRRSGDGARKGLGLAFLAVTVKAGAGAPMETPKRRGAGEGAGGGSKSQASRAGAAEQHVWGRHKVGEGRGGAFNNVLADEVLGVCGGAGCCSPRLVLRSIRSRYRVVSTGWEGRSHGCERLLSLNIAHSFHNGRRRHTITTGQLGVITTWGHHIPAAAILLPP